MTDGPSGHDGSCRLAWGRRGTAEAAARGDILVIVDTLSFSTAVCAAVDRGGIVYACRDDQSAGSLGIKTGAEVAVRRADAPLNGRFSLSPATFDVLRPGEAVVLASPNGGTCVQYGRTAPHLAVGSLVNASSMAAWLSRMLDGTGMAVTIIACGERYREDHEGEGHLRFAVEDYLGAGAIIARIDAEKSAEAQVCEAAFRASENRLPDILWECESGRELCAMGYGSDVRIASRLDFYSSVPVLRNGALIAAQ